jgi:hypothetical protein
MRLNDFSIGHFIGPIIVAVQSATEQALNPFYLFIFNKSSKDFSADYQRRVSSLKS